MPALLRFPVAYPEKRHGVNLATMVWEATC